MDDVTIPPRTITPATYKALRRHLTRKQALRALWAGATITIVRVS